MTRCRRVAAGVAAVLVAAAVTVAAPVAQRPAGAGTDPSLCHSTTDRLTVPDGYPLAVCWDGSNLVIKNTSQFVLDLAPTGSIGSGARTTTNTEAAGEFIAATHPSPEVLPPGYKDTLPVGSSAGSVTFSGDPGNVTYLEVRALASILPVNVMSDYQALASFVDALSNAVSSFDHCETHANFLARAGCVATLTWSVLRGAASFGTSVGVQLGRGSLGTLVNLVQTAGWAENAVTDLGPLGAAPKAVTIAAQPAAAAPTPPPAPATTAASVPVHVCPTQAAIEQSPTPPLPSTVAVHGTVPPGLQMDMDTTGMARVLAPASWSCQSSISADGGTNTEAWPADAQPPDPSSGVVEGVSSLVIPACVGCIYDMVCPYLPASALAAVSAAQGPCDVTLGPDETTTPLGPDSVEYTIPAGEATSVGGSPGTTYGYPDEGMVEYLPPDNSNPESASTDCILPTSDSALCAAVLANPNILPSP